MHNHTEARRRWQHGRACKSHHPWGRCGILLEHVSVGQRPCSGYRRGAGTSGTRPDTFKSAQAQFTRKRRWQTAQRPHLRIDPGNCDESSETESREKAQVVASLQKFLPGRRAAAVARSGVAKRPQFFSRKNVSVHDLSSLAPKSTGKAKDAFR